MNHPQIKKIVEAIGALQRIKIEPITGTHSEAGVYFQCLPSAQSDDRTPLIQILKEVAVVALERVEAWRSGRIAQLEAELKGEICPQPEPNADAYLAPLTEAFGPHGGLNADWSAMAWCVTGGYTEGVWILDDESPNGTVSLVSRATFTDGESVNTTIVSGSVDQILPIAKAIAAQAQHG